MGRKQSFGFSFTAFILRLGDVACVVGCGWLLYALLLGTTRLAPHYQTAFWFVTTLILFCFPSFKLYRMEKITPITDHLRSLLTAWACLCVCMVLGSALTNMLSAYSLNWFVLWCASAGAMLVLWRLLFSYACMVAFSKQLHQRVMLVGQGKLFHHVEKALLAAPLHHLKEKMLVNPGDQPQVLRKAQEMVIANCIAEKIVSENIDEVWLAVPMRAERLIKTVLFRLRHSTVNVRFVPDVFGLNLLRHRIMQFDGLPMLELTRPATFAPSRYVKVLEDKCIALVLLTLLAPVFLLVWVTLKISAPGPAIVSRVRKGWDGKPFRLYKFRTRRVHGLPACASRLTTFGRFLQATRLELLPQLWNVLQGNMSIVGPRPNVSGLSDKYRDMLFAYMKKHMVKPGLTGLGRQRGSAVDKMEQRLERDLHYMENWSLWLDIKILLSFIKRLGRRYAH